MTSTYIAQSRLIDLRSIEQRISNGEAVVGVFKDALALGKSALHEYFNDGASAADLTQAHSWLVDQLLVAVWQQISAQNQEASDQRLSLVAVGGYGRGELHPGSDVDLLILIPSRANAPIREFCENFVRLTWDIGLEVGHSVRTSRDCQSEARSDVTVATTLMESRLLCGDMALYEKMLTVTSPRKIWAAEKYFKAKFEEQRERHEKFEDTAYNLEPNIKDGPGGLRDIQMISWVGQRYFGTGSLKELVDQQFLSDEEYRTLIRGRNLLWRFRHGLHFIAGRREDRLLFDYQRTLAVTFGYVDKPNSLAVEQLMKRYYQTVKEVGLLNEILLQHFAEAILAAGRKRTTRINRRFDSVEGFLAATSDNVFTQQPFALLELFHILQLNPDLKGVRGNTIRLIRSHLHLIDQDFRSDIRCRSLFMEIIRNNAGLTHAMRRMNKYGVLGAYLPAFGQVVGQMQHDLFHVYTVDAHTLFVVRNARRFCLEKHRDEHPEAFEIMQRLYKPERLFLACLFHDIAKGRGGDHSELGAHDAIVFCRQHDLSEYDVQFVAWLVEHHLLMSWTAQHTDISDPQAINEFAATMGDQEHLDTLYLLTIADMRGTGPKVWNSWKGRLLADLYAMTSYALRMDTTDATHLHERTTNRKQDALRVLTSRGFSKETVEQCWSLMDDEYFVRQHASNIAWHTEAICNCRLTDLPIVKARVSENASGSHLMVVAPETDYLLPKVAGSLDRSQLNIVDARFHRLSPGLVVQAYVVLTAEGTAVDDADTLARLEQAVRQSVLTDGPPREPGERLIPRSLKAFPIETQVRFIDKPDSPYTVLEIIAQDRTGLIHQIAMALLDCKVRLVSARISTYGERAEDVFFLCDRDGQPVTDPDHRALIEQRIHETLSAEVDENIPVQAIF